MQRQRSRLPRAISKGHRIKVTLSHKVRGPKHSECFSFITANDTMAQPAIGLTRIGA